ncbi:hypothetical protein IQ269_23380 [Tychonema sp. LEGE 07199]|uniref:hypothetical protein n=1 Tax=unclassified Tychonema TaxID=2642144 RepID=UPI00187F16BD|nr:MULTISPECIES: hypothetical protein [unclassified Tychonema]MBE9123661.1 hypothetical protein [Tychonema sp. LEGE 07199]MBE9130684.1 hypothetical protein [Tychonema sp. LEGE 07196]
MVKVLCYKHSRLFLAESDKRGLTISNNGGVLPLKLPCEVNQLPPQFQRIEVSPDNSVIRQALEAGDIEAQKVAQFGGRDTHLSVL